MTRPLEGEHDAFMSRLTGIKSDLQVCSEGHSPILIQPRNSYSL